MSTGVLVGPSLLTVQQTKSRYQSRRRRLSNMHPFWALTFSFPVIVLVSIFLTILLLNSSALGTSFSLNVWVELTSCKHGDSR